MSKRTWVEVVNLAQANGAAANNSTAYKSLLSSDAQYTFPAGYFDTPGKSLRIKAGGKIISNVTGTSLTFIANLASINVFSAAATMGTGKAGTVNCSWAINVDLTTVTVGTATSFIGIASLQGGNAIFNVVSNSIPQNGPTVGLSVDTQSANALLDFGVAWGTANLNCSILLTNYSLEVLN